ncbi:MAG: radical SAM protein [Pseudomonadota bacterium]
MQSQAEAVERLINHTISLCKVCKNAIPAQVVALPNNEVWMRKACGAHGTQDVRLSNNVEWYEQTRAIQPKRVPPKVVQKAVEHGCPFDCGPCESHTQKVRLPVVTITSACNLDCPICYVHNKNDNAFHMGVEDFKKILGHLQSDHGGELDIVNFTGGEPTVHPHFLDFLALAKEAGIHRVTICSNGIRLAKDESLVQRIAELGGRVALSFDTFEKDADYQLQGANLLAIKMRCLELLEKHNVDTTLIPVMTRGVNDHEIGKIIDLALGMRNIRHLEIHTITFTGQSGVTFSRSGRISMYEVLQQIEQTTNGLLRPDDFVPSPCAHPLCYQIAYLLVDPDGGRPIPFSRFLPREAIYDSLSDRLYLEPTPKLENAMREAIDRLWVDGGEDAERTLRLLKQLLLQMFPVDGTVSREAALQAGEQAVKAIYVHSHMDEETFDTERAVECCDSNCYSDGTTIPVCNYNVLYREKEEHFNLQPVAWNARKGGQKDFPIPVVSR